MERGKRWESAQREINKKDKTKLTPLPVDPRELYCTPVVFAYFVCSLLSFCALEFPNKSETREPRKIIVECTSYFTKNIFQTSLRLHSNFSQIYSRRSPHTVVNI